ncbi:GNAT family N-acetyltransferase [Saccharibacillus sp. CPCC 101409]|uniref:GNAT family N-acetyltransferase n=1 Tax=Saccharibacillus sp. CPCC 101409 TaxID=3058041 RepID=UPI00267260D7|nr:GNAT family N-acetyltransferase [Saccharibacillus sp. CPCC 101409]MDO3412721.1 GNAT family N-acetyltransferase [Saccharibacillus sp. CPCC 101409]
MGSIEQKDGAFVLVENGKELAEVTYMERDEHVLMIDHTFVSESLRGQHVGEQLVDRVVQLARERNAKIDPVCEFAQALFRRKKEYADVWKQD